MVKLTKEQMLAGKEGQLYTIEGFEGQIPLRELTTKEIKEVEKISATSYGSFDTTNTEEVKPGMRQKKKNSGKLKSETSGKINMAKMNEAEYESNVQLLFLSMNNDHINCEEWSKEEVYALKGKLYQVLVDKVKEINGLEESELDKDIKDFHEDE